MVERKNIIFDATHKAMELKIPLVQGVWSIFKKYIEQGVSQEHDIYMKDIDNLMVIRLYNQKHKESYIKLTQK
jgi:hypothetical protein